MLLIRALNAVGLGRLSRGPKVEVSGRVSTSPNSMDQNRETWSQWFRENFTFIVLCAFVLFMLFYNLYVLRFVKEDDTYIAWSRETTNIFIGALVGIITGARMSSSRNPMNQPLPPTTKVLVQEPSGNVNVNSNPSPNPADPPPPPVEIELNAERNSTIPKDPGITEKPTRT